MISRKEIQSTCDDIVREFAPLQIILFGSYAYGNPPTEASDVDMLVVMAIPASAQRDKAVEIRQRIPHRFRMDLLVRSPAEIAHRVSHNDWFLREILEKGDVLYDTGGFSKKALETPDEPRDEEVDTPMNPLTLEYVERAEEDYAAVKALQHNSIQNFHNTICFHAQQCIEKYLKAWLQEANLPVPRTHNLEELLNLIVPTLPEWRAWDADFSAFTTHAVDFRYPGKSATAADAQHAAKIVSEVRKAVRDALKLS